MAGQRHVWRLLPLWSCCLTGLLLSLRGLSLLTVQQTAASHIPPNTNAHSLGSMPTARLLTAALCSRSPPPRPVQTRA